MKVNVFIFLWVFGLASFAQAADHVKGSGTLETRERKIADYNAIRIDGVYEIHYEQSDNEPFIEITVDDNLQQYVLAEIKDRTLTVGFKGVKVDHFTKFVIKTNSKWLKEARIAGNANFMVNSPLTGDETVIKTKDNSLVQLKQPVVLGKLDLDVSGSANIVVDQLEVDKLECTINGSGSITLKKGKAKEGAYGIMSSGDIHAFGVEAPELKCNVTGSGTAEVHATENLRISLVGSGHVRYKGPTAVHQKKIGKGTIEEVKD
jgi:hypothetical protein